MIPAFNAGAYLALTLDSILSQTYRDFEVVLVDDGSTDDTAAVAARYSERVRYLSQANSGAPARPRNLGIAAARGRYVCFFDSDDVMMPDKLMRGIALITRHPELGLVFTDFEIIDDRGTVQGRHLKRYSNFAKVPKQRLGDGEYRIESLAAFEALFFGNYIGTSSVIVPAGVLQDVGLFDEAVSSGGLEDRDMWLRIANRYPLGCVDFVGHQYRVRSGSVSKRALQAAQARVTVIRRHMTPALTHRTQRQARRVIADSLFSEGYQWSLQDDWARAERAFQESLTTRVTWPALRWWLLARVRRSSPALRRHWSGPRREG